MNCTIKVGDLEYTLQEFSKKIREEGFSFLGEPSTDLGRRISLYYDYRSKPDSLMEFLVKRELTKQGKNIPQTISKEMVDDILYPEGHMNDFMAQSKIKQNIDVGNSITGIGANTGKQLAYTFEAEAIESITIGDTKYLAGSPELTAKLQEEKVDNVDALAAKFPSSSVKRKQPRLKEKYRIKYGNHTYTGPSREVIDPITSAPVKVGNLSTQVFETIDMIINLAIDNVKEQKLFLLGITNSNANMYLAGISLGIPLQDVTRLFTTPIAREISDNTRVYESDLDKVMDKELDIIMNASSADLIKSLSKFTTEREAVTITSLLVEGDKTAFARKLKSLSINPELLDLQYSSKLDSLDSAILNYLVVNTMSKLYAVGQQYFSNAQQLSILRGFPSSKWKIDYIYEQVLKYSQFPIEEQSRKELVKYYKEEIKETIKESEEYQKALAISEQEGEKFLKNKLEETLEAEPYLEKISDDVFYSAFINRLIRRSLTKKLASSEDSVFEDNILLRIPHFYSAFRSLSTLKRIIETSFPMYSVPVREFAQSVIGKANIFTSFTTHRQAEGIAKEFIKFIASNITLELPGKVLDVDVPNNPEQWAQAFIKRLNLVRSRYPENPFLENVIVNTGRNDLKYLGFRADKTKDEFLLQKVREGFAQLLETPDADVAYDTFKYAILTQGLFFGRSNLSIIFPEDWAVEFSKKLEARINTIVVKGDPETTRLNLSAIEPIFIRQMLANNGRLVGFITGDIQSDTDGQLLVDDMAKYHLRVPYRPNLPKFIKRFDDTVYIKLETSSPTFAYYRVYTTGNVNRFYSFRPEMLTTKFDDTIFSDPKKLVIPISSIYNGSIRARSEGSLDQMRGESIYLVDTNDLAPREARLARVPEKSKPREVNVKGQKYFEIGLETLDNVSLFKEFASNSILSKRAKLAARAVSIVNDSRAVAMARTYMYKGAVAVTSDMFNPESTAEELIEVVNNLPESSMYIVSDSIINTIYEEFPSKALKLAKALNEKTSYYHPIIDDAVKPSNIERELTKLANYSSIVSERIFKAKLLSTDNGLLLDAESISKAKMARIALGTILDVGVINSKQTYAYVRSISEQGVSVTLFGQDIFESLDSPVYSQEGFDTILKENIKC